MTRREMPCTMQCGVGCIRTGEGIESLQKSSAVTNPILNTVISTMLKEHFYTFMDVLELLLCQMKLWNQMEPCSEVKRSATFLKPEVRNRTKNENVRKSIRISPSRE